MLKWRQGAGAKERFDGGNGIVDQAAAAFGERVGLEARDARAVEPLAQGRAGWRRVEEGTDRGLEENVDRRKASVGWRSHASRVAGRRGEGKLVGAVCRGPDRPQG